MAESPFFKNHSASIWLIADLLRGDYRQPEYGNVILPLTVLRRFDCVLESTKDKVLEKTKSLKGKFENQVPILCAVAKEQFFSISRIDVKKVLDGPTHLVIELGTTTDLKSVGDIQRAKPLRLSDDSNRICTSEGL